MADDIKPLELEPAPEAVIDVDDELAAWRSSIEARLTALETRTDNQVVMPPELGVLVEAIREIQEEDVKPRSNSWLYRTVGRKDD